ncbi:hypothetical protein ABZV93_21345 [Actinopolymorpha sp. NPDC004070]|uniref:NADPH-dependent FMN reductase n=1 Tax=Actinopolymorpha sp. NPDC004070 TaxID=3154548 RepID=UPI0033A3DDEC
MRTGRIRLAVIVGSTRPFRRAHSVAEWVCAVASDPDPGYDLVPVDLADLDLPMLAEPTATIR